MTAPAERRRRPRPIDVTKTSPRRLAAALLLLAAVLPAVPVTARASPAPTPAGPTDPVYSVLLTDGSTFRGRLTAIGPDGALTLDVPEGGPRTVPLNSVVKLSKEETTLSLRPEGSVLLFPDGDRIYRASVGAADDTAVTVGAFSLPGKLTVPLESLLGIVFTLPSEGPAASALLAKVREQPRASEVLWLANEDRLEVGFLGLTDRAIQYQSGNQPEAIERVRVSALGFDPALVAYPAPAEGFLEVTMSDGTRLGVVSPRLDQGQLVGEARFGGPIRAPLVDVVRIHPRTPSVVYLTERTPAAEKLIPYIGPTRPVRENATVEGRPFRLQGDEFDRGLGTQSRTLRAYLLEPGDRRFQATVGLDDRAGPQGGVVFKVMVDGREAFSSPPMAAGVAPSTVDVDVEGARSLILLTEFGDRGGVRDFADWVEARIIR